MYRSGYALIDGGNDDVVERMCRWVSQLRTDSQQLAQLIEQQSPEGMNGLDNSAVQPVHVVTTAQMQRRL